MTLVLVRHGETTYNRMGRVQGRLDTPLTPHGIEQAEQLADTLDGAFAAVYSSTLQRTHRTARILVPDTRITPLPALAGIDMGTATGMRKDDLHTRLDRAAAEGGLWQPPHGEHPARFQERVVSTLEGIRERHDGRVLVVTHGGVIRTYLRHREGKGLATAYRQPVPNGSVTVADSVDGASGDNVY